MNKKQTLFCILLLFILQTKFAFGQDFGGKITAVPQDTNPEVECPGTSFSITPQGSAPAGPYYSVDSTQTPSSGAPVLGKYTTTQGPCFIPGDPPTLVTTYTVSMLGVGGSGGSGTYVTTADLAGGGSAAPGTPPASPGRMEDPAGNTPSQTIATLFGTQVLKKGSTGQYVVNLQYALNTADANPTLTTDGSFGPKTETAVKTFQYAHNLVVDGIVGDNTKTALLPFTANQLPY